MLNVFLYNYYVKISMLRFIIFINVITQSFSLYSPPSNVISLTSLNFDKLVINSDEIWIVEFFAPWCGHCQQLVPEYDKTANVLKGIINVGAVNIDENKELEGRYGIKGFPTIKLFAFNKNKPENYNGGRTARELADTALTVARKTIYGRMGITLSNHSNFNDVIELTDDNFDTLVLSSEDAWMVEFFAPWCGHCRNLEPHWSKAATQLKGKVKFGALDATVHTKKASEFKIKGFPTIKYFGPNKKVSSFGINYDGGRTVSDIVNWVSDKLLENIPVPEIMQITDYESFKSACEQKTLCVVSIVPSILDCQSKCRSGYLQLLKEMAEKYKKNMWGWIWCEAGSQPDLENAFDMGGFGYPTMAVLNAKKMKYSMFRGSFSPVGINEFLRTLSYGRGTSASIRGESLPKIINTIPWDGKDGEIPQEEDIDLSDVVLDEKDEL